jgi:hypothetical protein
MTFPASLILDIYKAGTRNLLDLLVTSAIHELNQLGTPRPTKNQIRHHLIQNHHLTLPYDTLRTALDRAVEARLLTQHRPLDHTLHYTLAPHLITQAAA